MPISTDFSERCVVHFRTGDSFSSQEKSTSDYNYYETALGIVKSRFPRIKFYGIADRLNIAKELYGELKIDWVEDSDNWDSYKLFSVLSQAQHFVSSQSGVSIWALVLNPRREISILPRVSAESELGKMLTTGNFSNSLFVDSRSL